jgi:hypothetical protein
VAALLALHARKAKMQIATLQVAIDHICDIGAPESVQNPYINRKAYAIGQKNIVASCCTVVSWDYRTANKTRKGVINYKKPARAQLPEPAFVS